MLRIEEDINKSMIQADLGDLYFNAEAYSSSARSLPLNRECLRIPHDPDDESDDELDDSANSTEMNSAETGEGKWRLPLDDLMKFIDSAGDPRLAEKNPPAEETKKARPKGRRKKKKRQSAVVPLPNREARPVFSLSV